MNTFQAIARVFPGHLFLGCLLILSWGCRQPAAETLAVTGEPPSRDTGSPACPVEPTGTDYSGQNLENYNFSAEPKGALIGANFTNAKLRGSVFAGKNLTGASFRGADLGPSPDRGRTDFGGAILEQTCFIGATTNATDFQLARFRCADFTGASLMETNFGPVGVDAQFFFEPIAGKDCRTSFRRATIDVRAVPPEYWKQIDFTAARFQNATPELFDLRGKDASGALLADTHLSGIDFTGADLSGTDLTRAKLFKATFDRAALNGATLDQANLISASLVCARFHGEPGDTGPCACRQGEKPCTPTVENAEAATLTQASLGKADLSHAVLDSAALHGADLTGATARGTSFVKANLEGTRTVPAAGLRGADLSGAIFQNAHLNKVSFFQVIAPGARFDNKTSLDGTVFTDSILPGASFDQATLEDVRFSNSILQEAVFTGATMKTNPDSPGVGVDFTCAQLGGASFDSAVVTAASFADAVMPPAGACCEPKGGTKFRWCGTVDLTGSRYGPVTYPVLDAVVTCPNPQVGNAECACRKRPDGSLDCSDWEIPRWQSTCADGHTLETVWRQPPCGTDPTDIVHFADDHLEQCILDALPGKPSFVTVETAATIGRIVCPGRGIAKLGGLESFTGLTHLDLSANQLTQLSFPTVELEQLQTLSVEDNRLTLLDVGQMPSLARLEAANNQLQSVGGVGLPPLQIVDLSGNRMASFDLPIYGDTLLWADLSGNQLTGVLGTKSDLGNLANLSYLDLSGNSLRDVGSVSALAYAWDRDDSGLLQSLFLGCNPSFDCTTLDLDLGDGKNIPLVGTSRCAAFNSQDDRWILLPHPSCQPGG